MAKAMKLGILAGMGELPIFCAREAQRKQVPFKIYLIAEEQAAARLEYTNEFHDNVELVSLSKFGKLLKTLAKDNITDVVLLGKVRKEHIFKGLKFDLKALSMLAAMPSYNDDEFFNVIEKELRKKKIKVLPQYMFLQSLLLEEGIYTKKKPRKKDESDINYGLYYAKKIGELDIGQTVVVRNRAVLAIEAIEGTDACIERAGEFSHGNGGIVCKGEKIGQDVRFDMPTVGTDTLVSMKKAGCHILAIEAKRTFVVNPPEFIKKADELGIIFVVRRAPLKP